MFGQGFDEPADRLYLSEVLPKDKPWDKHRSEACSVRDLYDLAEYQRLAERMNQCSRSLGFRWGHNLETGELKAKLESAFFCRVRYCPVCQWRRTLKWDGRFFNALPQIMQDYPSAKYVFLTLTVRNCELSNLRSTLTEMNQAWKRLTERKKWPALGFARSLEVTRGKDGSAHPHFHALLMVPGGHLSGRDYMTKVQWAELWQSCLKASYTPSVHIRVVRPKEGSQGVLAGLQAAIQETFKYQVKPDDLIGKGEPVDAEWLAQLTRQMEKTRSISLGGVFKQYLSEDEPEDLIGEGDDDLDDVGDRVYFGWQEPTRRYVKR